MPHNVKTLKIPASNVNIPTIKKLVILVNGYLTESVIISLKLIFSPVKFYILQTEH